MKVLSVKSRDYETARSDLPQFAALRTKLTLDDTTA